MRYYKLTEAAKISGVPYHIIRYRIKSGYLPKRKPTKSNRFFLTMEDINKLKQIYGDSNA